MSKSFATFLDDVKRSAFLPCTQNKITDADITAWANEELQQNVWASLVLQGEEFFLVTDLLYIKNSSGGWNYPSNVVPIPRRAYARAVREIKIVSKADVDANKEPERTNVPWITMEHAQQFEDTMTTYEDDSIYGCYFLSDGIKFHGNFRDSDDLLEIRYVAAPPTLVNTSDLHGDINQIVWDSLSSEVQLTVASVGTGLNAYCATAGTALFDIYRKSSGALLYAGIRMTRDNLTFSTTDLQAADVVQLASFQQGGFTGALNTLTSGYSSELMILPAEQQNYIPLSPSSVNMLQAQVVQRVILAQGDTEMYAVEKARAKENQKKLEMIHNDRLSGEARTIPMNNGLLNAIRRPGRYFRRN